MCSKIAVLTIIIICIFFNISESSEILYDDFSETNFNINKQWTVESNGVGFESVNTVINNGRLRISLAGISDGSYLQFRLPEEIKLKNSMSATIRLISADPRSGVRMCGDILNIRHSPDDALYNYDGNIWVGIYIENMNGSYRTAMTAGISDSYGNLEHELIPWETVANDLQLNTEYHTSISFDDITRTITLEFNGIQRQFVFDSSYTIYPTNGCKSTGLRLDAYIRGNTNLKQMVAEIDDVWVSDDHYSACKSLSEYDEGYSAGKQACIDDPLSCGIAKYLIFSNSTNPVIQSGSSVNVYGNPEINRITLKSGASAKLINFVGSNEVTIQADSTLFNVSRSGAAVTFKDSNGTVLTIPATKTPQTILQAVIN